MHTIRHECNTKKATPGPGTGLRGDAGASVAKNSALGWVGVLATRGLGLTGASCRRRQPYGLLPRLAASLSSTHQPIAFGHVVGTWVPMSLGPVAFIPGARLAHRLS
jgi:hypothetical protein